MRRRTIRVFQFSAIAAVPLTLWAFSTGPPIRRTGAAVDGGITCTACHTGSPVNDNTGGNVAILAGAYRPGEKQNIRVRVNHPDAARYGFEITARLTSDETKAAGVFAESDTVQVKCDPTGNAPCNGTTEFAQHRSAPRITGPHFFTVEWTAPATDVGPVIFYAAANAANNSGNNQGDHIYTTRLIIPSAASISKPAISQNGVQHGASFAAGIAPNSWVQIKGSNLNLNTRIWQEADFEGNKLPIQLENTSVKINGKDAFVYYISPTQINVLAPADDAVGPINVQVTTNGVASDTFSVQMQRLAPAFFLFGNNNVAATHADRTYIGPTTLFTGATPARPGETVTLFGSGFGVTNPAVPNGEVLTAAANLTSAVTIRIGGVDVTPTFAGLRARSTGVYEFTAQVPAAAADGDVPVVATIGGVSTPTGATIRVQR